jgi:hypothetical protein
MAGTIGEELIMADSGVTRHICPPGLSPHPVEELDHRVSLREHLRAEASEPEAKHFGA